MADPENGEQHWLKLAQDTRAQAASITDAYSKRTLLLIAQRYEMLAERARRTKDSGSNSECV